MKSRERARRILLEKFKEKTSRIHHYILFTFVRTFKSLYTVYNYKLNPLLTRKWRGNCWSNINIWMQIVMRKFGYKDNNRFSSFSYNISVYVLRYISPNFNRGLHQKLVIKFFFYNMCKKKAEILLFLILK